MLRSAERITIRAKSYYNNNEILFSPIIDLFGLILRSDHKVPQDINKFLQSHGAKIKRIQINEELFIMLQGKFNITKFEVELFIIQNKELSEQQKNNIISIKHATKMQQLFNKTYNSVFKQNSNENQYFNGHNIISVYPHLTNVSNDFTIQSLGTTTMSGSNTNIGGNSSISSNEIKISGKKLKFSTPVYNNHDDTNKPRAGYMATHLSLHSSEFLFRYKLKFKNCLIDAGGPLTLCSENGHAELKFSQHIDWKNNPYSAWQMFNKIKSDVTKLENPNNQDSLDYDTPTITSNRAKL